jgi:hypothetical protein
VGYSISYRSLGNIFKFVHLFNEYQARKASHISENSTWISTNNVFRGFKWWKNKTSYPRKHLNAVLCWIIRLPNRKMFWPILVCNPTKTPWKSWVWHFKRKAYLIKKIFKINQKKRSRETTSWCNSCKPIYYFSYWCKTAKFRS